MLNHEIQGSVKAGLEYLKDPSIFLSQIAWLLGYERASFVNHAFRRWTGRPPSVVRQEMPLGSRKRSA